MRVKRVAVSVRLGLMVILAGGLVGGWAVPGQFSRAEASPVSERREPTPTTERPETVEVSEAVDQTAVPASEQASASVPVPSAEVLPLSELERPATTVTEWVAQIEASLVQITGVRVEATEAGLQVVLETADGSLAVPETRAIGNALIADIPNATIAEEFSQAEPIEGIALVNVTSLPGDRVRVAITGTNAPPVAEITAEAQGLAFVVTVGEAGTAAEDDAIQVVVTGEQDEGYNPSNATTATRTDTPLRDIPQSITVVPRQVLEDRNVQNLTQAVETVPGVVENFNYLGSPSGGRLVRGFPAFGSIRNGFRESPQANAIPPIATIEQVEVLRGPSSVVIGAVEPGGIINYVTRQPLNEPSYTLGFEAGNFELYQPSIDLTGPLTADGDVLYRFIAAYENRGSYQEFANSETTSIAPSISFNLGDRTDINLYYEYSRYSANPAQSVVPLLSDGSLPPRSLFPSYPSLSSVDFYDHRAGYTLTHRFDENWQIRNNFAFTDTNNERREIYPVSLTDDRSLNLATFNGDINDQNYFAGIDLLGRFETGSISHRLLVGFDFNYFTSRYISAGNYDPTVLPPLDLRNPDYDAVTERPEVFPDGTFVEDRASYGVYLQDQIEFNDNLILLIGGRYDWTSDESGLITPDDIRNVSSQSNGAFSPRVGLVYQPSENVSLYASYSRSFNPAIGRNPDNRPFEPTRGTQYEAGVKADFLDGRLSTTLAAYNLTRTNVLTPDPDPALAQQGFQVQVGEQRSRGVELDVTGEILPGWNIIASYALTDTEVTADNSSPSNEGNRFANVPQHQASLWTTYEIQRGDLQGLGFGLGLFYVGERQGNLANSFQVSDYLRTDAAIYYRRNRFSTAINIRNLFDIAYVSSVNFGDRLAVSRGEPFTIVGSVRWEF